MVDDPLDERGVNPASAAEAEHRKSKFDECFEKMASKYADWAEVLRLSFTTKPEQIIEQLGLDNREAVYKRKHNAIKFMKTCVQGGVA